MGWINYYINYTLIFVSPFELEKIVWKCKHFKYYAYAIDGYL